MTSGPRSQCSGGQSKCWLQAFLGTAEVGLLAQASCEFVCYGNVWHLAWKYGYPFSVFLGSPRAATCLKHASELDILGRTKALVLRLIMLDVKHDQK